MPSAPYFITLEGIEGCGKSTQARILAERIERDHDRRVVLTREPGGSEVTREIRRLLADPKSKLDRSAELLLFLADRAQHVAEVIEPALRAGSVVVCDRYSDSTIAYQGYGRGHELKTVEQMNTWASSGRMPDLTLWIDCDIATGVQRAAKQTGGPGDRFESEPLAFHERVREGFAALAANEPERIARIDGDADVDTVSTRISQIVEASLR